jgi:hypothetical protein
MRTKACRPVKSSCNHKPIANTTYHLTCGFVGGWVYASQHIQYQDAFGPHYSACSTVCCGMPLLYTHL